MVCVVSGSCSPHGVLTNSATAFLSQLSLQQYCAVSALALAVVVSSALTAVQESLEPEVPVGRFMLFLLVLEQLLSSSLQLLVCVICWVFHSL